MTEKGFNNCMLLHIHKDLTDSIDEIEIAKEFLMVNEDRKQFFGTFPTL